MRPFCLAIFILSAVALRQNATPKCRFAPDYTASQLLFSDGAVEQFLRSVVIYEAKFINEVGTDPITGLTLDGSRLDVTTGELLPDGLHRFTASSKESIHIGVLAKILEGAQFSEEIMSQLDVFRMIEKKVITFENFNKKYPGFGGYLPWVAINEGIVEPTYDFKNRVPALDNGEMFWACIALSHVWESKFPSLLPNIRRRFDAITWQIMAMNARKIFFNQTTNKIRAVASIRDITRPVSENTYQNEDNYYLDDPYEGEMFIWILELLAKEQFTRLELDSIWIDKRNKLKSINFTIPVLANATVTVEQGFWFSAHEQWKNIFLPYSLSPTYKIIQLNNEKARTWSSFLRDVPGMYASMSGPASNNFDDTGYFSDAGVPSISVNPVTFTKLVTPYSVFPLMLIDRKLGAVWLHNMLMSPGGQTKYGALEGTGLNGTLLSPMATWDTKITTVLAIMNGTRALIESWLNKHGFTAQFTSRIESEYSKAFPYISGLDVALSGPPRTVTKGRKDFTTCQ